MNKRKRIGTIGYILPAVILLFTLFLQPGYTLAEGVPWVQKTQILDSSGNPLASGTVTSYIAGTSTPLATYTDATLGTPNSNPLTLDSAGRANIWLDETKSYKIVVKDSSGSTVYTIDNISSQFSASTFVVGSGAAEDTMIRFDGNAQDYHFGLDDSNDKLTVGLGSSLGTTTAFTVDSSQVTTFSQDPVIIGTTPTLTIGDAGPEDTAILYDGNATDFIAGLDDSTDKYTISIGSALGTDNGLSIDTANGVLFGPNSLFNGQDPVSSGHNHNLLNPDFWYDDHHRRLFLRSIFFGEIDDPVDIGLRRATGTYPDTLGSSPLGSGDTIGHLKWYPWNGSSYQGSSAMIYAETAEIPTATDTGGSLYFGTCPINGDSLGSSVRKWVKLRHNGTLEMYTRTATEGSSTPYRMLGVSSGGVTEFGDSSRVTSMIGTRVYLIGESSATPSSGTLSGQKGTGTNIAGAGLILAGGAQTGNAIPGPVYLKAAPLSESSGTTERTPVTRFVAGMSKVTTDAVSTDLFSVPIASTEVVGFRVVYTVWARSGGNVQVEFGHVDFHAVNLAGAYTKGTPTPVMGQSLSSGTLSVTFAISSANPTVVSVTVDTSLTPTSGWPKITYNIENLSPADITVM